MPARTFVNVARAVRRWSSAPVTRSMISTARLMIAVGDSVATAGNRLLSRATCRLVILRNQPRRLAWGRFVALAITAGLWLAIWAAGKAVF